MAGTCLLQPKFLTEVYMCNILNVELVSSQTVLNNTDVKHQKLSALRKHNAQPDRVHVIAI
jgi:hypothetical protein